MNNRCPTHLRCPLSNKPEPAIAKAPHKVKSKTDHLTPAQHFAEQDYTDKRSHQWHHTRSQRRALRCWREGHARSNAHAVCRAGTEREHKYVSRS